MRFVGPAFLFFLTFLLGSRATAQNRRGADDPAARSQAPRSSGPPPEGEAELATIARLDTILRLALDRNRDLAENQARARAAQARSQAASRLPDMELKYEQWAVPLRTPLSLDRAGMLMLGQGVLWLFGPKARDGNFIYDTD